MIGIKQLQKSYRDRIALQDISLEVASGQALSLCGLNGSGRSTLLRILATLEKPTAGEAFLAGVDLLKNPLEARRKLAYLPQDPPISPHSEAGEYLGWRASSRGLTGRKKGEWVSRALSEAGVEGSAPFFRLSRGLQQRVLLMGTLLDQAAILLLDEPLAQLDPSFQARALEMLKQRRESGATIVIACNSWETTAGLCDRAAFFQAGQLLQILPASVERSDWAGLFKERMTGVRSPDPPGLFQPTGDVTSPALGGRRRARR